MAVVAPLCTLIYLPKRERRRSAILFLVAWIIAWGGWFVHPSVYQWQMAGMRRVAQNSLPLIAALEKFHTERGRYPEKAEELIPRYLPTLPYTGVIGYPAFDYKRAGFLSYQISISPPLGFLHFDSFMYRPEKKYPEYGDRIERIGDWGYYHE